ncbi:hypothetical protein RCL_jg260.t1 [Rhizophagus clarus]|uniref:Uncharacterized protein n=1 Tax=Rhizophagus clarus TaxID=94130 RepID=A0A8H3M1H1_9GLOM|nr:hypothetical protein RCL_jg260.t1 [Rhizophagus clarus]
MVLKMKMILKTLSKKCVDDVDSSNFIEDNDLNSASYRKIEANSNTFTDGIGSLTFKLGGSLALWILDGISRLLNLMDLR